MIPTTARSVLARAREYNDTKLHPDAHRATTQTEARAFYDASALLLAACLLLAAGAIYLILYA